MKAFLHFYNAYICIRKLHVYISKAILYRAVTGFLKNLNIIKVAICIPYLNIQKARNFLKV